MQKNLED